MRKLLSIILVFGAVSLHGQSTVSDYEIIKALLGQNLYNINPTLTKLGVWYHYHFKVDKKTSDGDEYKPKIYSISNSEGHTKVYIIRYSKEDLVVNEIQVNFRHDDRTQVEDMKKINTPDEFHVGTYSTDLVYKLKR